MKKTNFSLAVCLAAAILCVVGAVLRTVVLQTCMDADGILARGSHAVTWHLLFVILAAGLLALLCSKLNRVRGGDACFGGGSGYLFVGMAGAIAVFFGSLLLLLDGSFTEGDTVKTLLCVGGMLAAVLLCIAALLRGGKKGAPYLLLLLPAIFATARLISNFRSWSLDPLVIDFCTRQLAAICAMLALHFLSGFSLKAGRKRSTIFWCLCTVICTVMSLPDFFLRRNYAAGDLLIDLGLMLWCLVSALQLLRRKVQTEVPPPEIPVPEAPVPETPAAPPGAEPPQA